MGTERMKLFKKFDVVSDYSDHYFANSKPSFLFDRSFAGKKLVNEFKRMEMDLTESFYVRSYKGRRDLLRAVVIGAAGTPYHDGLFFFDFQFSADYPMILPKIHYHSFGLGINPFFSASGRVILGKGPINIPHILLSIQALLLTEKPYFSNLVYGQWAGRPYWEEKALAYNENVFLNSCKTMLYLLAKPPMHFQEFVAWHFQERGGTILSACRAYMDGSGSVQVGGIIENRPSSKKFKAAMEIYYPKLSAAFSNNECGDSMDSLEKEKPFRKNVFYKLLKRVGIQLY